MIANTPVNKPLEEGILLLNKPLHWTSFDVVKKVRFLIKAAKVGHAGTLDPLATGLVIICTGKTTKLIDSIQAQEKVYTGSFVLGATTDSYDLETVPKPTESYAIPPLTQVEQAAKQLSGTIEQVPPIYSAIKVGGKRAYKYAREGSTLELKSRQVTVHEFAITEFNFPLIGFMIRCSKGTYIRSIAHDLGEILGTGAYLNSLCRTQIGDFRLEDAFTIEGLGDYMKVK
ncbi:MAG: tRNA pseudouridine(55) synthase TruB [Bacteroidia bacterium]|nr:tRNA pseudouridine(55) synthase TruB [Bacteroidia bacterium]MCO5253587.1 tRNA pseudouridine(55) synthase TruB [Bacteroidota bacterium]